MKIQSPEFELLLASEKRVISLHAISEQMTLQGKMMPGEDNSGSSSSADPNLLETIDKLFELNVGDYVALPQVTPLFTLSLWQRCLPHC